MKRASHVLANIEYPIAIRFATVSKNFYHNVVFKSVKTLKLNKFIEKYTNIDEDYWKFEHRLNNETFLSDRFLLQYDSLEILDLKGNGDEIGITDEAMKKLHFLRSLDLSLNYEITSGGIKDLLNLTSLTLSCNELIDDSGIEKLTNMKSLRLKKKSRITDKSIVGLTNITSLTIFNGNLSYLYGNNSGIAITDVGLKELKLLTNLNINNANIGNESMKNLTNLTKLNIGVNSKITNEGITHLTNIKKLHFSSPQNDNYKKINDSGLKLLTNITKLNLHDNYNFSDDGISQLINLKIFLPFGEDITMEGIKHLVNLTHLCIVRRSSSRIGDGISILTNLQILHILDGGSITDIGVKNLTNLTSLHISSDKITSEGVKNLTNLKELNIHHASAKLIGDEGIMNLTKLTDLTIEYTERITDNGLKILNNLQKFSIISNIITDEGISRLTNLNTLAIRHSNLITNYGINSLTNLTSLDIMYSMLITDEGVIGLTKLKEFHHHHQEFKRHKNITVECIKQLPNLKNRLNIVTKMNTTNISNLWKIIISQIDFIDVVRMINVTKTLCRLVYYNMVSLEPYTKYIEEKQKLLNDNNRMIFKSNITIPTLYKFVNLGTLDLSQNNTPLYNSFNNDGLKILTGLTSLNLDNNQIITDDSIKCLKKIQYLDLSNNNLITDEGIKGLIKIKREEDLILYNNTMITKKKGIRTKSLILSDNYIRVKGGGTKPLII